jgi:hypothetical protein
MDYTTTPVADTICSADKINKGDTLICMIDEWNEGDKESFDCHITSFEETGVNVIYLSGFRSRNDFVPWEDVVAKVDLGKPWIDLEGTVYKGNFEVFNTPTTK